MSIYKRVLIVIVCKLSSIGFLSATPPNEGHIHFGSKKSGFLLTDATHMDFTSGTSLSSGSLRARQGIFTTSSLLCNDMKVESGVSDEVSRVRVTGVLALGESPSITLGETQVLQGAGGSIAEVITIQDAASIIGYGSFENDIIVTQGADLSLAWQSSLDTDIVLSGLNEGLQTQVILERDLVFKQGHIFQSNYTNAGSSLNYIDCNGYRLTMGGDQVSSTHLSSFLRWKNANILLDGPLLLSAPMLFTTTGGFFSGGGNVVFLADAGCLNNDDGVTTTLSHIVFDNVSASTFTGGNGWDLDSVTLRKSDAALKVTGRFIDSWTDLVGGNGTIHDASITLQSDLIFNGTWTLDGASTVDGGGHRCDMLNGNIVVFSGSELFLNNLTLDNVSTSTFGGDGLIHFSHVTIILADDADWTGYRPQCVVDGPVTFITGRYSVVVNSGSTINNTTVWYDTQGTGDLMNVTGFSGNGRVRYVIDDALGYSQSVAIATGTVADSDTWLYPTILGTVSSILQFQDESIITYNGQGHKIICPSTTDALIERSGDQEAVIFVGDGGTDTIAVLSNVTLEAFKPSHLQCAGGADALIFGHNTTIRLAQDWIAADSLHQQLFFGSDSAAQNEEICLDLSGHTINLGSIDARLIMRGASSSSLRIKNGRLIGVGDTFAGEDPSIVSIGGAKIIFEDVEICLIKTFSMLQCPVDIVGHCSFVGYKNSRFDFISDECDFTITSHATLSLKNGCIYYHDSNQNYNFVFVDNTATLELIGATFRRKSFGEEGYDPLVLKIGTLCIDHISHLDVGDSKINIGEATEGTDLHIIIRPGATLKIIGGGAVQYLNRD